MGWHTQWPTSNGLATSISNDCCMLLDFANTPTLKGYLPLPMSLRASTLSRKRGEYQNMVDLAFAKGRDGLDQQIWHQIEIDVPRTRPGVQLWMHEATQRVRIFIICLKFIFILAVLRVLSVFSTFGPFGIRRVVMYRESMT